MKFLLGVFVVGILSTSICGAQTIYKCQNGKDVTFSQSPCGADAVKITTKRTTRPRLSSKQEEPRAQVDAEEFIGLDAASTAQIISRVGSPVATYSYRGVEHWLYANAVRTSEDDQRSPEVLIKHNRSYQISWMPTSEMKNAVTAAEQIGDWQPQRDQEARPAKFADAIKRGQNKSEVLKTLGEPNAKRVAGGLERWEYFDLQTSNTDTASVTVFLDFIANKVAGAVEL